MVSYLFFWKASVMRELVTTIGDRYPDFNQISNFYEVTKGVFNKL